MVFCYTKKGKLIGGTSFAIRIANYIGIPVYNIGDIKHKENISKLINKENMMRCFPKLIKRSNKIFYFFNIDGLTEKEVKDITYIIPNSNYDIIIKGNNIYSPKIINFSNNDIPKLIIEK